MSALLWIAVPAAPLIMAALVLRWPGRAPDWLWLAALPALVGALWPFPLWQPDYLWPGASWQAAGEMDRGWLAFSALVWLCASRFGAAKLQSDPRRRRFWCFWSIALSGNLLLVIAQDALSFYVGFTQMSLAAYGLIVHEGGPQPRRAGRIYLQLAMLGEMLLLAGFLLRAQDSGATDFASWQSVPVDGLTLVLLLLGFGIKIGFWPLHFWLPLAHPAAPSAASAVLSGAMIEAGVLGLWRSLPASDPLLNQWAAALLALGLFTAFYGVLLGLLSSKGKSALAFSSVSQMGYFLMVLALSWRDPEHNETLALLLVLFAAHHGFAKAALFLATSIHPLRPTLWFLLAIPALAIAGFPLSSGGVVKAELEHSFEESDFAAFASLLKLASLGTALLLARALVLIQRADHGGPCPPRSELLPWLLLCALPMLAPWLWPGFRELLLDHLDVESVWGELWPILVAIAVAAIVIRSGLHLPAAIQSWRTPALPWSVRLKRWLIHPPLPTLHRRPDWRFWRQRERSWNRFWNRRDPIASTAWLLVGFVLLLVMV